MVWPEGVGRTGRVAWLTPFAPSGFSEVWAVVDGAADVTDLTEDDCQALGQGLSRVLAAYRAWNLASFNFAVIGGGPHGRQCGHHVVLKVVSRSTPEPMYRSDATYFERIYAEALIDVSPKEVRKHRPCQVLILPRTLSFTRHRVSTPIRVRTVLRSRAQPDVRCSASTFWAAPAVAQSPARRSYIAVVIPVIRASQALQERGSLMTAWDSSVTSRA